MKIFGLVVAVHAAVFMLIFAIPGCRSSARQNAVVTPAAAPADAMVSYATPTASPALSGSELNPAITPAPLFDPNAPAMASGSIRFSPTRPGAAVEAHTPPPAEAAPAVNYTVVKGDSLWTVAKRHGVTVAELAAANNLMTNATLQLNQKLIIPQKAVAAAAATGAPATTADVPTYTVKSGDTLGAIARRNGTTVEALRSANRLSGDSLRAGQILVLPAGATVPAAATETAAAGTTPAASAARSANSVTHTVAPGETLSEIARRYGVRYAEIATANNITDPTRVRAGQELVIPGWQAPAGSTAAAPASTPAASAPSTSSSAPVLFIPGAADDLPPAASAPASDIPVIRVDEPGSSADSGAPRIN
ncbi:MAG TPA: LysM peptidoglycan-binding domain-containing protein [Opitutaceae bacterium]